MNQLPTFLLLSFTLIVMGNARMDDCYLRDGTSQRCLPPFVNAAYGKTIVASNTCGTPAEEYCLQTGVTGVTTSCHTCDNENPSLRHTADFLTDFNSEELSTWWQSSTMLQPVQFPNTVNLTLDLNKAFDITYVRLRFHTSRPESFAIYKKKCPECEWQPFQYYSGSCFATYGLDNKEIVTVENEQKPLCTDDFSDISPLTGGNVAFSTLESRPSAYNFDKSPILQDWVKATAIRISLNRINTFGDEVFEDPNILKSYSYAISDLSIGGRCACNGHASECYVAANNILQCRCKHNTAGKDCELCADMFNDRPWFRATRDDPAACQACDCNDLSETCYFDPELYRETGHGGHCTSCRDYTSGPHCELCLENYYRGPNKKCTACDCDEIGSISQQCDLNGQCTCKAGVGGKRCDRCVEGHYGLSDAGCRPCLCSPAGTVEGTTCDAETGACVCKLNVEGQRCDRCKRASMNLQRSNPYGCTSCFCFGHSSSCNVSEDYTVRYILSEFNIGDEDWTGRSFYGDPLPVGYTGQEITMQPEYHSYFVAPDKFLGSQRFSYNQMLEFDFSVQPQPGAALDLGSGKDEIIVSMALPGREDIILEGEGQRVTASIISQGNPVPNEQTQLYRFRLHEAAGFTPRLTPLDFQKMLNNLDKIHIRSTYGEGLVGRLDNFQLKSAERDGAGEKADWVEYCELDGYLGDFSDRCAPGYTRDPPNGGIYAPCVPCNCNGHSDFCDGETGICECNHNTIGDHCELCMDGYYFSGDESRRGTPQECQPCPCPQGSACAVTDDGSVVCTSCPAGHAGKQCEMCMDGWFGDPRGRGPCLRCMCNGNIDENAVMNCDRMTGECLKCIHNTTGFHCESCLPGYFGKPVTSNAQERCRLCECDHIGSVHITVCNAATGQCQCRPNVEGRRCDRCKDGYWNLASGEGCQACNCDQLGSSTGRCDLNSGQCDCQPGVGGQRCDRCLPNHYLLSPEGCTACDCNADGSISLQCGEDGRCECKEGVLGLKCDRCQDNYYDIASGCIECPTCYGLVQDAVETQKRELQQLENLIDSIGEVPVGDQPQGDARFQEELDRLNDVARQLQNLAEKNKENKDKLSGQTDDILETLRGLMERLAGVEDNVDQCASTVQEASDKNAASKNDTKVIKESLQIAEEKLKQAMMDLTQAQVIAVDTLTKEDNMSRIAEEAEALASSHQASAQEITDAAQSAYDASRRAQDSIQEALDLLESLMNNLDAMVESENKLPAARRLRDDLLNQTRSVKDNAETAKSDSTDLFAEASKLVVPSADTDAMDTTSQDIQTEAEALMPRITELDSEYKQNFGDVKANVDRAQELLNLADAAQDTADLLLAQAHAAYEGGREAVRSGNETYQSVLDTKKSLESFDEEIHMNREDAERALGKVDEIQAKIDQAGAIADEARTSLGSARAKATQANDKAQQSQEMAENIQRDAGNIRDDADRSHERATEIAESVSSLQESLENTGDKLQRREQQAEDDATAVALATDVASAARTTASDTKNRVNSLLQQLHGLLLNLNVESIASVPPSGFSAQPCTIGEVASSSCECGAEEQTVDHVINDFTILQPPNGANVLRVLDDETKEWLLSNNMIDVNEDEIAQMEARYEQLRREVDDAGMADILEDLQTKADKQDGILRTYDKEIAKLRAEIANLQEIEAVIPKDCSAEAEVEQP